MRPEAFSTHACLLARSLIHDLVLFDVAQAIAKVVFIRSAVFIRNEGAKFSVKRSMRLMRKQKRTRYEPACWLCLAPCMALLSLPSPEFGCLCMPAPMADGRADGLSQEWMDMAIHDGRGHTSQLILPSPITSMATINNNMCHPS